MPKTGTISDAISTRTRSVVSGASWCGYDGARRVRPGQSFRARPVKSFGHDEALRANLKCNNRVFRCRRNVVTLCNKRGVFCEKYFRHRDGNNDPVWWYSVSKIMSNRVDIFLYRSPRFFRRSGMCRRREKMKVPRRNVRSDGGATAIRFRFVLVLLLLFYFARLFSFFSTPIDSGQPRTIYTPLLSCRPFFNFARRAHTRAHSRGQRRERERPRLDFDQSWFLIMSDWHLFVRARLCLFRRSPLSRSESIIVGTSGDHVPGDAPSVYFNRRLEYSISITA